jgi:sugar-specific transcriptional regulator TrmB
MELTDYEVRAYVSLLENGPMIASQISSGTGVPYSKIYEVLGNLERKGWVESEHGRPSKYYPKSPSTALQGLRLRRESQMKENEDIVLRELMPLYERKRVQEKPDIWIIRGEFNILAKVNETLGRCQSELLVAIPGALNEVVEVFAPALTGLKKKNGAGVKILTTKALNERVLSRLSTLGEVKTRTNLFGGGIISDAREVVLFLGDDGAKGSPLGIWSDHRGLAEFAKNYYEYLWKEADQFVLAKQGIP